MILLLVDGCLWLSELFNCLLFLIWLLLFCLFLVDAICVLEFDWFNSGLLFIVMNLRCY